MTKEESLSFLQSCIDKVNSATAQDIQFYREMYDKDCSNKDCSMIGIEADKADKVESEDEE